MRQGLLKATRISSKGINVLTRKDNNSKVHKIMTYWQIFFPHRKVEWVLLKRQRNKLFKKKTKLDAQLISAHSTLFGYHKTSETFFVCTPWSPSIKMHILFTVYQSTVMVQIGRLYFIITSFYSYGFCASVVTFYGEITCWSLLGLKVEQITFLNETHFVCRLERCADIQPMIPM